MDIVTKRDLGVQVIVRKRGRGCSAEETVEVRSSSLEEVMAILSEELPKKCPRPATVVVSVKEARSGKPTQRIKVLSDDSEDIRQKVIDILRVSADAENMEDIE